MRILILTQVFPPERHPTAVMVDQLATYLTDNGHSVAVGAGLPAHPSPAHFPAQRWRAFAQSNGNGYLVVRGGHPRPASRTALVRGSAMIAQALAGTAASLAFRRPDVVVVFGFPMIGPLLASLRARLGGAAVVSVVYDLYPDIAIESGMIPGSIPKRAAHGIAGLGYQASDRIVVLSDGFREQLTARGVPESKVDVIPVWLDPDEVQPMSNDGSWALEHGLDPNRPIALYAGTMGLVSGAEVLVGAASILQDQSATQFVLVGEGLLKPELERRVRERRLNNVVFLPFQPRSDLSRMQSAATVALVTLAQGRGRTSVPSKVITYLAAGTPVVGSVDESSDTAHCVRSSGGAVTPPGDPSALARGIEKVVATRHRSDRSRRAREYFEHNFSKDVALAAFARALSVTDPRRPEEA